MGELILIGPHHHDPAYNSKREKFVSASLCANTDAHALSESTSSFDFKEWDINCPTSQYDFCDYLC